MIDYSEGDPHTEIQDFICQHCGHCWSVYGLRDHGRWTAYNEDDLKCEECDG